MRLIGLLSFYDEPVTDLVACIKGLHEAGVTELVALDGAYQLFPDGKAASPSNQHAAVVLACRQLGIGCTLHVPSAVWAGNEVEKRTFLFKLGWTVAEPGDWFWVMDADQFVTRVPDDFLQRLERAEHDAAEAEALDVVALRANQPDWPPRFAVRNLFRAQPITVRTNHCTYVADDGRLLWGGNGDMIVERGGRLLEDALDLTDCVEFEHRPDRRPRERLLAKLGYYVQRDEAKVERGDCSLCDSPSTNLVPTRWKWTDLGPVAAWAEACDQCAVKIAAVNAVELRGMGIDPASVVAENRNGRAPVSSTERVQDSAPA